jgi:FMN phosphatase YigB (HAD superfamily)
MISNVGTPTSDGGNSVGLRYPVRAACDVNHFPLRYARRTEDRMSLSALAGAIEARDHEVLSTDVFDTLLLRDHTTAPVRFALACRRAAPRLGVDAAVLTRLRWTFQETAYRAVAMERPAGDATLAAVCHTVAMACGLDAQEGRLLHRTEVDVDIEHLRPNLPLVALLEKAARAGMRVIAVSDTYYSARDLRRMLDTVVGDHSIGTVYSSADEGGTKHAGSIFTTVTRREAVAGDRILHVGDNLVADVERARAASWTAVHLPRRDPGHRAAKIAGRLLALPTAMRRAR